MSESVNDRFKMLRKLCNKSQEEFGRVIGITKSGISDIEGGRRKVTEQHIIMLRNWSEFNVNENWLRTGSGDMFNELPEEDEMARYVEELLYDTGSDSVYNLIKSVMRTYNKLDGKSQEVIRNSIDMLIEDIKKEG
jgi:transcriptional regulator with XRE-family HTH domain